MEAKDTYEDRVKMVEMHDDVLKRIDENIKKKKSIEACWLIYACFESRIMRTLEKVSISCPERKCYQNHRVGIVTRIACIKRLIKQRYSGIDSFDTNTLGNVRAWCKERNELVHALLTLNNYEGIDAKFLALAKKGEPLVKKLYTETTNFRNLYYKATELPVFPENAMQKCKLIKNDKTKQGGIQI